MKPITLYEILGEERSDNSPTTHKLKVLASKSIGKK